MTFNAVAFRQEAATIGSTQDLTSPGFGTPKLAMFFLSFATTPENTVSNGGVCIGATDGDNQFASCCASLSASAHFSNARSRGSTDCCILMIDPTTGSVIAKAHFGSWITDGIQLTWDITPSTGIEVICVLMTGSDLDVKVDTVTSSATEDDSVDYTSAGFTPEALIVVGHGGLFDNSTGTVLNMNLGFVSQGGQRAQTIRIVNGRDFTMSEESQVNSYQSTDSPYRLLAYGSSVAHLDVTIFLHDGFTVFTREASVSMTVGFVAFSLNGTHETPILDFACPDLSGNYYFNAGCVPQLMIAAQFPGKASDEILDSINGDKFGVGVFDVRDKQSFSVSMSDEDQVVSSEAVSLVADKMAYLTDTGGVVSVDADDVDVNDVTIIPLNFNVTNPNSKWIILVIGYPALVGQVDGSSSTSGTIRGLGSVAGGTTGSSSPSGTMRGLGQVGGSAGGDSAPVGSIVGLGRIAGTSPGSTTVSPATIQAIGVLAGLAATLTTTSGVIQGIFVISGSTAGSSTLSGSLAMLAGMTSGLSTLQGLLTPLIFQGCYELLHNAVRRRVKDNVEIALSTPTGYDNAPFSIPADSTWIRATIELDSTEQVLTGTQNTFRKVGVLKLVVHTPIEMGTGQALRLADSIKDAFREITDGQVLYQTPSVENKGRVGLSRSSNTPSITKWWQVEVSCPFYIRKVFDKLAGTAPSTDVTDFADVASIIRARFKANVADPQLLPVDYDNAPFIPPDDVPWCRWSVLLGSSQLVGLGKAKRYRTPGVAIAMIHVPVESGDLHAIRLADIVDSTFKCVTDKSVTFKTPSVRTIGRTGKWWQVNVSCPFYSDQIS